MKGSAVAEPNTQWLEAFKKLPADAQERVQSWLGTQAFIARELGLQRDAWLAYVEWAMSHPFDYSFLGDEGVNLLAATQDAVVNAAAEKARAQMIGGEPAANMGALTNPVQADGKTVRKAGLANIHMLGSMLDENKKKNS